MDCELNQLNHLKDPTQTNDSDISDSLIYPKHITLLFASHTVYDFRKLVLDYFHESFGCFCALFDA